MSKGSSERTLLLDSGFPMLSSRIMAFNLIAKSLGIDIPLQPIDKEMGKLKLSIRS